MGQDIALNEQLARLMTTGESEWWEPHGSHCIKRRSDGMVIAITGRMSLHAYLAYYTDSAGNQHSPASLVRHTPLTSASACISGSKKPEVIAREIVRRVVKPNEAVHAECVKRIEAMNEHASAKNALAVEVAKILGTKPEEGSDRDEPRFNLFHQRDARNGERETVTGRVRVNGSSMRIDQFSVPAELGLEILALVQRWKQWG